MSVAFVFLCETKATLGFRIDRSVAFSGVRRGNFIWIVAALTLLAPAPAAVAATPANDDFAEREVLSGSLPIEVTRSNVEATKESGEWISPFAAGHSVWFEWEAEEDGFVTLGACDDEFPTIVGIFTGTEIDHLTPAVEGNAGEGPDCPYTQRQFTFDAVGGTKYVIAVDGNGFYLPEGPKPVTEGEIFLRIEKTPTPPNDDFEDAQLLAGEISEEPGGSRFYFAHTLGDNWKATTEAGEPFHGTGSGASVWYSWTAPETAKYSFGGPCCGAGLNWSLYSGDSVGELTEHLSATGGAQFEATAGTTYRIAVYGTPDLETEEPAMGSFSFIISAQLPLLPPKPSPEGGGTTASPPDTTPPDTFIKGRKIGPVVARFWFASNETGAKFLCKVDKRPRRFRRCGSPATFQHLDSGRHVLRVKAVDAAGNADLTPAVVRFRITRPPGAHGLNG